MALNQNMHAVAHHLQVQANAIADDSKDAFARSAYNRYYYSIFLQTREMLRQMNSDWSSLPHASYPEVLAGKVKRAFKSGSTKAQKQKDWELVKVIGQAERSIGELRKIILKANATRVVADYEPEQAVDFVSADRFSLQSIDVTEAHGWSPRAETLCTTILRAWKQFNV